MRISAIICTLNRPAVLHDTILSVKRQTIPPIQILIASPSRKHVLTETLDIPGVTFIETRTGLCVQRNQALDAVAPESEIVAFLDDDLELTASYFAEMVRLFTNNPQVIIASGTMLRDGGRGGMITRDEAATLCHTFDQTYDPDRPLNWKIIDSGYGCNMIVRHASIGDCRFDERLPLYAWLEDRDFSHRVTLGGCAPVECENAVAVHLGARSGRVSGVRLGFSTIVNPIYLRRKANTFSFGFIFVHYWLRCLVGNILGIITLDKEYDRVGLIRGNMIGFYHLLSGKCDPEYIFKL